MKRSAMAAGVAALAATLPVIAVMGAPTSASDSAAATVDIPGPMLRLYESGADRCPGLGWAVLAAIGKIESDHGRSTARGVRSGSNAAGAAGPMQFGIGGRAGDTWTTYGVDGNADGRADVYDPADAVPAAAAYLCAHGAGSGHVPQAIYAYNHADWYVSDVLAQAAAYTATSTPPPASGAAQIAITFAASKLGLPYKWGGVGPLYDCSGLTQAAYAAAGVRLDRTSREQYFDGPRVTRSGLEPGDLVFYATNPSDPETIHHLGLYVGQGLMIESPHTGAFVRYAPIDRPGYIGAIRPTAVVTP